jgi:XXXCH domain-containing protein
MKTPKQKIEKKIELAQLGAFFREIADAIEGREAGSHQELKKLFNNYRKVSIEVKRKSKKASLRIKVEAEVEPTNRSKKTAEGDGAEIGDQGEQTSSELKVEKSKKKTKKGDFKRLKKNMKASFKAIREQVSASRLPERSDLDQFIRDSEQMLFFPGYGDEYYPAYQRACQALKDAADRLDFATFKHQLEEIKKLMQDCHDRYK